MEKSVAFKTFTNAPTVGPAQEWSLSRESVPGREWRAIHSTQHSKLSLKQLNWSTE